MLPRGGAVCVCVRERIHMTLGPDIDTPEDTNLLTYKPES